MARVARIVAAVRAGRVIGSIRRRSCRAGWWETPIVASSGAIVAAVAGKACWGLRSARLGFPQSLAAKHACWPQVVISFEGFCARSQARSRCLVVPAHSSQRERVQQGRCVVTSVQQRVFQGNEHQNSGGCHRIHHFTGCLDPSSCSVSCFFVLGFVYKRACPDCSWTA